jgi:hypothetical protein
LAPIEIPRLCKLLDEVREEFEREAHQSILKKDHSQGMAALGGMDAVRRIERRIAINFSIAFPDGRENKVRELRGKRGSL